MNHIIAPSILSADFSRLGEEVKQVLAAGADWVHVDVMDNHYVPNLTVGPLVCQSLRQAGITAPLDVHLMVEPVDPLIPLFAKAGATWISFHPEASKHPVRTLQLIRQEGCHPAIALNPGSPLSLLDPLLEWVDMILLMSVNPGFGGQSFIESSLSRIQEVRRRIQQTGRSIRLEVDGGIKIDNIGQIAGAGADTFVAGSAIFESPSYAGVIEKMREKLKG